MVVSHVNRYRQGHAQFSDITILIGVYGAGIAALLGQGKEALFGADGAACFAGFFDYFIP